jgi:hypothetical protein
MSPEPSQMNTRRPVALVLGFGLLIAAGALGFMFGSWRAQPPGAPVETRTVTIPAPEPVAIAALRDDVRALREDMQLAMQTRSAREPAVATLDDGGKLVAAIERLEATIARLDHGASGAVSTHQYGAGLKGLGQEIDQLDIVPRTDDGDVQPFLNWAEKRAPALTSQYLLWTVDEVIGACGRPTRVETNGDQISLNYDLGRERDGHVAEVQFIIASLRVVRVEFGWR